MRFNIGRRNQKRNNPFAGIIFGIGLFLGSFVMLYLNEGRVDLSKIARNSEPLSAEVASGETDGAFVAVSGTLRAANGVTDSELLTTGDFLQLDREAEMYAWDEDRESNDDGPDRITYDKEWTSSPSDSDRFDRPNGHYNPPMRYSSETFTVESMTLGNYAVGANQLFFRQKQSVNLEPAMLQMGKIDDDYLYIGVQSVADPNVGDIRVQYSGFANGQDVTLFGQQDGDEIRPYIHRDDTLIFRVYPSDRDSAIASMRSEFLALLWGFRGGGFMMMWIGLMAIVSPLTNLLGRVPVLGDAGNFVIGAAAFGIALVLSVITIIISALLQNPIALVILFLAIVGGGIFIWQQQKKE